MDLDREIYYTTHKILPSSGVTHEDKNNAFILCLNICYACKKDSNKI